MTLRDWRISGPTATDHEAIGLNSKSAGDVGRRQGLAKDRKVGVLANPYLISEADTSIVVYPAARIEVAAE
jgi:hypothetical protein